ncbi:MAG: cell filamentation protein Fic [Herbinix sp.]|jgi:Fic family protein|nr:cell filamentation protein Fic [Herbinix sp.]
MTKQELFQKADYFKSLIDTNRPFDSEQLKELDNYFRVGFTYSSNSIEGNTLTITETKILLEDGITVGGKPIKDYYEASGHAQAYDYMLSIARTEQLSITEDIIKKLHYLFYHKLDQEEAGQYRKIPIYISGTEYLPPNAEEVPHLMKHFINQMQSSKRLMHPIEFAAICHKRLVDIHPFKDGNGRTARLLMNLILVSEGYGITSIPPVLRNEYINALILSQRENNPDIEPFLEFIAECVIETERDYCRLLKIK